MKPELAVSARAVYERPFQDDPVEGPPWPSLPPVIKNHFGDLALAALLPQLLSPSEDMLIVFAEAHGATDRATDQERIRGGLAAMAKYLGTKP